MTETPEQIAEMVCPCSKINNYCSDSQHWYGCPATLRPAVAAALQSERDSQAMRIAELEAALVNAAIPLEALIMAGTDKMHGDQTHHEIHNAVDAIRSALTPGEKS